MGEWQKKENSEITVGGNVEQNNNPKMKIQLGGDRNSVQRRQKSGTVVDANWGCASTLVVRTQGRLLATTKKREGQQNKKQRTKNAKGRVVQVYRIGGKDGQPTWDQTHKVLVVVEKACAQPKTQV